MFHWGRCQSACRSRHDTLSKLEHLARKRYSDIYVRRRLVGRRAPQSVLRSRSLGLRLTASGFSYAGILGRPDGRLIQTRGSDQGTWVYFCILYSLTVYSKPTTRNNSEPLTSLTLKPLAINPASYVKTPLRKAVETQALNPTLWLATKSRPLMKAFTLRFWVSR